MACRTAERFWAAVSISSSHRSLSSYVSLDESQANFIQFVFLGGATDGVLPSPSSANTGKWSKYMAWTTLTPFVPILLAMKMSMTSPREPL
ncbi:hypothetical protein Trydic_g636 [Trypoxylus dichotomus]